MFFHLQSSKHLLIAYSVLIFHSFWKKSPVNPTSDIYVKYINAAKV